MKNNIWINVRGHCREEIQEVIDELIVLGYTSCSNNLRNIKEHYKSLEIHWVHGWDDKSITITENQTIIYLNRKNDVIISYEELFL